MDATFNVPRMFRPSATDEFSLHSFFVPHSEHGCQQIVLANYDGVARQPRILYAARIRDVARDKVLNMDGTPTVATPANAFGRFGAVTDRYPVK